jgi:hypothetical protein
MTVPLVYEAEAVATRAARATTENCILNLVVGINYFKSS